MHTKYLKAYERSDNNIHHFRPWKHNRVRQKRKKKEKKEQDGRKYEYEKLKYLEEGVMKRMKQIEAE